MNTTSNTSTGSGYGYGQQTDPAGTHGPHHSAVGNAMDPRVDSDRDDVRTAGMPGAERRDVPTGRNDPEGTHGPHSSRAANAADPRVDSDRDNVRTTGTAGATENASASTNTPNQPQENQKEGGLLGSIKGRVAQVHGIGESARGHFNATMGNLMHDEKGAEKGANTAAGGEREFANKEFGRHGTWDKAL